jgi:type IX secretion system PorP/SprF family membrane protein
MRWLLLSVFGFFSFWASAQNEIVFSHYLFNPSYYNPAFVGHASVSHAMVQFRSQWTGYQASFDGNAGAPLTQAFTGIVPLKGKFSGFGISATNDQLGPVNNIIIRIPLSYTLSFSSSKLIFGIAPELYSQTLRFDQLRFVNPGDPLNIGSRQTQAKANVTAGMLFAANDGLNVGLSVINVLQPNFDYGLDSLANQLPRSYSVISAYDIKVGRDLTLTPSIHLRSDLTSFTFDVGGIINYNQKAWGGISYRYAEALSFFVGYALLKDNKLNIGYALDYVIDEQNAKQPTSQEFFIRYNLPNLVVGGRKQIKTPRFAY